ncbi:uncharacterized protein BO80DRAFT_369599 [Aspergillus ibericus CBS 121593]|uniref:PHD-type domain-containing protein n=1 Tax=Aspergillus ibericus CBS 121593 TaxID=1448316 RepID=A0A395GIU3_9EURO|nr:hypothetical protein BO80DRAFT_369599 [Aspergillus ibericus CBS 121593]RAK95126.1 hypothetical protein BO80DRAFT_369599 [Aspergillus ibericus CBS 121593]
MSPHNGAPSSLASIETAPPTHGTLRTTTSGSHPPTSSSSASIGPSAVHPPSISTRPPTVLSKRVEIPRLSAATAELLARVTGNLKGAQRNDDNKFVTWTPPPVTRTLENQNSRQKGKMRASSTIIELPTAPFVYSNNVAPPAVPQASTAQGNTVKPVALHNIAPKPTSTSSAAEASEKMESPTPTDIARQPARTSPAAASVPQLSATGSSEPTPLINVTPKPTVMPSASAAPEHSGALAPANIPAKSIGTPSIIASAPQLVPVPTKSTAPANIAPTPAVPSSVGAKPASPELPIPGQPQSASAAKTTSPAIPAAKPKKPAATSSRQRKSATNGNKRGKKRRRNNDSDGEDVIRAGDSSTDESDVAPTATQTKSGRLINRPSLYVPPPSAPVVAKDNVSLEASGNARGQTVARKRKRIHRRGKDAIITCLHCQRGHSPSSNSIVLCDECNAAWHQLCHDPPINAEVITVKEKEWFCQECRPVQISIVQPTVVRSNPSLTTGLRGPSYPPLVVPKAEVGAGEYSTDERRGFLSGLSHAALVELLMTISDNNPILPMFPENMREQQSSKFAFRLPISDVPTPSTSVSGNDTGDSTAASTEANQNGDSAIDVTSSSTRRHEVSDDDSEYEFQEHRLYPRAGNGFRLSLNVDDMDIMREDTACPTFSYSLHGTARVRAQTNEKAPVWGS